MTNEESYSAVGDGDQWLGVADSAGSPVRDKSFSFALAIISLYRELQSRKEFVISKQLLRSGTSIGANVEEATAAESRRDFIHKMNLASKEARETFYWLRLLSESDLAPGIDVSSELSRSHELVRLLTSIVKSTSKPSP